MSAASLEAAAAAAVVYFSRRPSKHTIFTYLAKFKFELPFKTKREAQYIRGGKGSLTHRFGKITS
jgi:hypothetical protein